MSNTKRKIFITGQWWHPTRRMKFWVDAPMEQVEYAINQMRDFKWFRLSGKNTYVTFTRKSRKFGVPFKIRRSAGKNADATIRGTLEPESSTSTYIDASANVGNRFVMGLLFFTHFISMGIVSIGALFAGSGMALFFGLFPLGYLTIYSSIANHREKLIDDFLLQLEQQCVIQEKRKHDTEIVFESEQLPVGKIGYDSQQGRRHK